jgi:hypothetical protein
MFLWAIWGYRPNGTMLYPLRIVADSYDVALSEARKIDSDYSIGQCLVIE